MVIYWSLYEKKGLWTLLQQLDYGYSRILVGRGRLWWMGCAVTRKQWLKVTRTRKDYCGDIWSSAPDDVALIMTNFLIPLLSYLFWRTSAEGFSKLTWVVWLTCDQSHAWSVHMDYSHSLVFIFNNRKIPELISIKHVSQNGVSKFVECGRVCSRDGVFVSGVY